MLGWRQNKLTRFSTGNVRMTIVDRYLFFLFLKAFLVCFLSFAGLFVIGHLFSNLDEMQDIGEATGWASLFRE